MKSLLLACLLSVLAGCGFQPLYAGAGNDGVNSGSIDIAPIDGRQGYLLRRALLQELSTGIPGLGEPVQLTVDLRNNLSRLELRPDGAASRSSVTARGTYRIEGETIRLSGSVEVETGFLVPDSPFGDIAAQTTASDRAMRILAKRLADDIRLRFARD